ncbi:MAG: hypothetical protein V1668_01320 [Patescibacteria group bacterium]
MTVIQYTVFDPQSQEFGKHIEELLTPSTLTDRHNYSLASILNILIDRLGAKAVVNEPRYIDADYANMYAHWYATALHKHDNLCTRLHFFKTKVSLEDLRSFDVNSIDYLGDMIFNFYDTWTSWKNGG